MGWRTLSAETVGMSAVSGIISGKTLVELVLLLVTSTRSRKRALVIFLGTTFRLI